MGYYMAIKRLIHIRGRLLPLSIFSGILFLLPNGAWAADNQGVITFEPPIQARTFQDLLAGVLQAIIPLALTVGVIAIIWAGFRMIWGAARGNPGEVQKARAMLGYVVLGIIIIAAATTITGALQQFLSGL